MGSAASDKDKTEIEKMGINVSNAFIYEKKDCLPSKRTYGINANNR